MHYMHYKDYIHHGLAAEKTPPPLPQGGEPSGWVGGVWGSLLIYIHIIYYIYIYIPAEILIWLLSATSLHGQITIWLFNIAMENPL